MSETRKGEMFRGATVAIITPFNEQGTVDYSRLEALVDWQVEQGTQAIAPVGTTGESPTLSHEEHRDVIATVIKRAAGRIKVMAGTGSNSTAEAVELTKFAQAAGADGALVVGPYYNKPTQEGYRQHFLKLADECHLPIVVYNIPGRTGSNITPETIVELGKHPNIVAVKEASGSLDQVTQILRESNLSILSGDDSYTLPMLAIGGSGVVSVAANLIPDKIQKMLQAFFKGEWQTAMATHHEIFPLCKALLTLASNPIPIKSALQLVGKDSGQVRLPLTPLAPEQQEQLRHVLATLQLLP